jgi:cytochrome b6-f complex iron-sulfur subunit
MSKDCTRRCALKGLGGFAAGTFMLRLVGCGGSSSSSGPGGTATMCSGNLCLDLTNPANAALANVGGSVIVDAPADTLVVIRTSASTVTALSAICTHQGCLVEFDANHSLLLCPCHGSEFAETGRVVQGPARSPLRSYQATLSGNQITVVLA